MKRGKKPARPGAIKLRFGDYLRGAELPVVPNVFGHVHRGAVDWQMLGNDNAGDCVVAGAAHESMVWAKATQRLMPAFRAENVLEDYSAISQFSGGPAYVPSDPSTDNGLDMQMAAKWRQQVGVLDENGVRHKVSAYAAVRGVDHVVMAAFLFGACGIGLALPDGAEQQFEAGRPWDVSGDPQDGHYVPVVGRNSAGNIMCVTWGRLHAMTPHFIQKYMDEAVAYFSMEYLMTTGASPESVDQAHLQADLDAVRS